MKQFLLMIETPDCFQPNGEKINIPVKTDDGDETILKAILIEVKEE